MSEQPSEYQATEEQKQRFWHSFLLALQAEPRDATAIKGASGVLHPVVAVGVDDIRRRIVVVLRDPQPRSAALAQFDIQTANPAYNVVLARPVSVNLAHAANAIVAFTNTSDIGPSQFAALSKAATEQNDAIKSVIQATAAAIRGFDWAVVDLTAAWQDAVQQVSHTSVTSTVDPNAPNQTQSTLHLGELVRLDPTAEDRSLGNCAVPLYDFEAHDAEVFHTGRDIEAVRDVLRRKHLLQYFYPSPDQLVLGIAEGGD